MDWRSDVCSSDLAMLNILISGATGSGKTTLSKGLIQLIPSDERLLTIEDTRELIVGQKNVVHMLYAKDGQGTDNVTAKHLLESALRMRQIGRASCRERGCK